MAHGLIAAAFVALLAVLAVLLVKMIADNLGAILTALDGPDQ